MRRGITSPLFVVLLGMILLSFACGSPPGPDYPFQPVLFTQVRVSDQFWLPRMETNRKVTIPYAFDQCEKTGRINNFAIAGGMMEGSFGTEYPFDDSDVYKVIEGAAYSLQLQPDPDLDRYLDDLIAKIAAAQEEDGYLYTARTIPTEKPVRWTEGGRWANLYMGHELYNMGHLYEAAVAHFLATGKRSLLDIALKNADLIDYEFGPEKRRGAPGHQVIEIGLAKLFRITGEKRYLDLAKFFLDERGRPEGRKLYGEYSQDHIPVTEQNEAVGHAVRAAYMYAGMADIAALTGDVAYIQAIDRIWDDVVGGKLYLTGGIGATNAGEAFGEKYDLPNESAYAETCAAIANIFWNHRQFLLHGDARYIDVLERTLYNGFLSGVGLSGDRFFYPNPLSSDGRHERSPWFTCACCPSNISRFVPSIPGYVYAHRNDELYVNLFVESSMETEIGKNTVNLSQVTEYPWEGKVEIRVDPESPLEIKLKIRIPGWAREQPIPSDLYRFLERGGETVTLKLNGEMIPLAIENGYASISRTWNSGDTVELDLPIPVRRIISHPLVKADEGRVALQRGPLVYCAEWPDNTGQIGGLALSDGSPLRIERREDLFNGVAVILGEAYVQPDHVSTENPRGTPQEFTAIPYFAWAHRGKGEMAVWIKRLQD